MFPPVSSLLSRWAIGTVGTLKFYYKTLRAVDRTQYALASGFAEILSTQLAIHELEVQKELTARAEVRALQAQINPHFLFNTLNTIASFTRTDPLRARELLREFSSFYRATLDNSGSLIPVSREVAQTKRYLTFEKARFGEDRVLATFDVSEDVEDTAGAGICNPADRRECRAPRYGRRRCAEDRRVGPHGWRRCDFDCGRR